MRRLLAVSWEMPPMYGPRATQVSRTLEHLGQLGWESTVVCLAPRRGGPHWPDGRDPAPLGNVRRVGVPSREESLPVRAAFRLVPSLRRWPDSERLWVAPAARAAIREASAQPPLGFVTFAQPWSDHLVGLRIRHSTSLPWVAHFSDPWTDSPYLRVNGSQRRAASRMEAEVIRQADAIVFVNGQTADLVMRKFPASWRHKAHVVPHGFDRRRLPPAAPREPGPLRLVYTGRFYRGIRTPLPLLRALADLDRAQPLGARLAVQFIGPQVQEFEAAARELGVGGIVSFAPRRPIEDVLAAAARADVLLVIDAPSAGPSPFLPSKLVDYLMFRKPILGLTPVEGASADLLRSLACPVVAPDDVRAIGETVRVLLDRASRGELHVSADFDRVAESFDIHRTTERFHDILVRTFAPGG